MCVVETKVAQRASYKNQIFTVHLSYHIKKFYKPYQFVRE